MWCDHKLWLFVYYLQSYLTDPTELVNWFQRYWQSKGCKKLVYMYASYDSFCLITSHYIAIIGVDKVFSSYPIHTLIYTSPSRRISPWEPKAQNEPCSGETRSWCWSAALARALLDGLILFYTNDMIFSIFLVISREQCSLLLLFSHVCTNKHKVSKIFLKYCPSKFFNKCFENWF